MRVCCVYVCEGEAVCVCVCVWRNTLLDVGASDEGDALVAVPVASVHVGSLVRTRAAQAEGQEGPGLRQSWMERWGWCGARAYVQEWLK
jgi:hypothetical protein